MAAAAVHVFENPPIPFNTPIYNGVTPESKVEINGDTYFGPNNGFVVEFPSASGVSLHFSARMGLNGGENAIVMNSANGTVWQQEMRYNNCLGVGQAFKLEITNKMSHYAVVVNNVPLADFYHRQDPASVLAFVLRGDVRVHRIVFEKFTNYNGTVVKAAPPPTTVVYQQAPPPATTVVVAPPPRPPMVEVVVAPPPPRPIVEVVVAPPPRPAPAIVIAPVIQPRPLFGGPNVVVIEEKGRHHHHHHGRRH